MALKSLKYFEVSTTVETCCSHLKGYEVPPTFRVGRPIPGACIPVETSDWELHILQKVNRSTLKFYILPFHL